MSAWWVPPTLRGYGRSWLGLDALAGLTLVAVALPSQMATALLANLPVVAGLYAFIAGSMLYALVGKNGRLSVGADSTIAPVLATGVASVAVVGTAGYGTAMAFTALLVGAVLVAAGLFRLGWIAEFFSTPVITGILAGIAVEIIVRQIPIILGVPGTGGHHHRPGPLGDRPAERHQLVVGGHRGRSLGGDPRRRAHQPPAPRCAGRPGPVRGGRRHPQPGVAPWRGDRRSRPRRTPAGAHPVGFVVAATPSAGHGAHRGLPLRRPDRGHGPGVERGPGRRPSISTGT